MQWTKLRWLNYSQLRVDISDHTYATKLQGRDMLELGRTGDCYGGGSTRGTSTVDLREDPREGVCLTGAASRELSDIQHAVATIEAANRNRVTSATAMNDASSRSHSQPLDADDGRRSSADLGAGSPSAMAVDPFATALLDTASAPLDTASALRASSTAKKRRRSEEPPTQHVGSSLLDFAAQFGA